MVRLACAIKHNSYKKKYVQISVLEPRSCANIHINKALHSFGWAADGTASTCEVGCPLFGTITNTMITVARGTGKLQRHVFCPPDFDEHQRSHRREAPHETTTPRVHSEPSGRRSGAVASIWHGEWTYVHLPCDEVRSN